MILCCRGSYEKLLGKGSRVAAARIYSLCVVHTMSTMAGAIQFSQGYTSVVMPVSAFTVDEELGSSLKNSLTSGKKGRDQQTRLTGS